MSLATAVVVATFFAIFGFPYVYYRCWYSWGRLGTVLGLALYLLLAGGGGGLTGWAVGRLANAAPTSSAAVNGALYGVAGALAVRADFRTRRTKAPEQLRDVVSILGLSLDWTTALLDERTRQRALVWFTELNKDELQQGSFRIRAHLLNRQVSDKLKKESLARFVGALEQLQSEKGEESEEGRALLATFSADYCVAEHLPRDLFTVGLATTGTAAALPDAGGGSRE